MKTVLVITSSYNSIVDYISCIYSKECFFFRLDVDRMCDYSIQLNKYGWCIDNYREFVTQDTVHSIYYTKPNLPKYEKYDEAMQKSMKDDIGTIINGIMSSFDGRCLTKPQVLEFAENKIYQMYLANKIGFMMPDSLIANNKRNVIEFTERKRCLIKPISAEKLIIPGYTYSERTILPEYQEPERYGVSVEGLEVRPAYLQRMIKNDYEVKSNYICGKFYTARIDYVEESKQVRGEDNAIYSEIVLPEEVEQKCSELMKVLELDLGTFHFIVREDEYYFLEVNPNGDWIRAENEFGWRLSADIVNYLCV